MIGPHQSIIAFLTGTGHGAAPWTPPRAKTDRTCGGRFPAASRGAGGDDVFSNTGSITGGVTFNAADETMTNAHMGTITGPVAFNGGGSDTVDNAGKIDGAVTLVAGSDMFTNAGDIDGAVTFTGTGTDNILTNSGTITGNVTLAGATSTLTTHGQIYGNVALAGSDTLTNTGTIHGNVTVGASDTIDDSRGEITAAKKDTFDYKVLFGEETIDKFVAGSASTHDTIQFAANDFGSFAAVQSAMSQVGSDYADSARPGGFDHPRRRHDFEPGLDRLQVHLSAPGGEPSRSAEAARGAAQAAGIGARSPPKRGSSRGERRRLWEASPVSGPVRRCGSAHQSASNFRASPRRLPSTRFARVFRLRTVACDGALDKS